LQLTTAYRTGPIGCPAGEHVIKIGKCITGVCTIEPFQVETSRVGECCGRNQQCAAKQCPPNMEKKAGIDAIVCATEKCMADQCCVKKNNAGAGNGVNSDDFEKEGEGGMDFMIIAGIGGALILIIAIAAAVIVARGKRGNMVQKANVARMSMVNSVEMGGMQQQFR